MKKLRGKKRVKAHRKRLEQSLNVQFHPSLKKTPLMETKYTVSEEKQSSLSYSYLSTFDRIKDALPLERLKQFVDILYLDQHVIAINKVPGLLTARANDNTLDLQNVLKSFMMKHRDFRDWRRFLEKSVLDKFNRLEPFVGVVHRVDKATSGVVMYGRHEAATKQMIELFARRRVKKTYIAVIRGEPPQKSGDLEHFIATTRWPVVKVIDKDQFGAINAERKEAGGGVEDDDGVPEAEVVAMKESGERTKWKKARMHYRHLQTFVFQREQYSVLRVQCFTGRQHQVRAQLSFEKMPIVGDHRYHCRVPFIPNKNEDAIALHAWLLEYQCPFTGKNKSIEAPLPDYWNDRFGSQIQTDVFDHLQT